jgi:hypothetical protein
MNHPTTEDADKSDQASRSSLDDAAAFPESRRDFQHVASYDLSDLHAREAKYHPNRK